MCNYEQLLKDFMTDVFTEKELVGKIKLRFGVFPDGQKVKNIEERFTCARIAADSCREDTDAICGFYPEQ